MASFGAGSLYERLLQVEAKILLLGVDYTALPLFMYLEWLFRVSYRYEKAFHGRIRENGVERDGVAVHFVRDERLNPQTDRRRIGRTIDRDDTVRKIDIAYGTARTMPARTVERIVARELEMNSLTLLREDMPFQGTAER
jgi:aminoglycoside N3'-acetyltransferase